MLKFFGYDLELYVDEGLVDREGVSAWAGRDYHGRRWLIVAVGHDPECLVWICAPVSDRAGAEIAAGRATIAEVVRHSTTGTVEMVTVDHGRAVADRCLLSAHIPVELWRVGVAHRG